MNPAKQVQEFLSRLNYKPEFSFQALNAMSADSVEILIARKVIDSKDGHTTIPIISRSCLIPEGAKQDSELRHLIFRQIRNMELHEMDEWLKIDGIHVVNPHPEISK